MQLLHLLSLLSQRIHSKDELKTWLSSLESWQELLNSHSTLNLGFNWWALSCMYGTPSATTLPTHLSFALSLKRGRTSSLSPSAVFTSSSSFKREGSWGLSLEGTSTQSKTKNQGLTKTAGMWDLNSIRTVTMRIKMRRWKQEVALFSPRSPSLQSRVQRNLRMLKLQLTRASSNGLTRSRNSTWLRRRALSVLRFNA